MSQLATTALCLPPPSDDEAARLDALHRLDLLDTPPNEAFDRITRMASQLFGLPIAAVSLTDSDRQWFKSRVGVEHSFIPREKAPCAQVADTSDPLVIPDLLTNDCYQNSHLARSGIRFYAGAPLMTRDGFCLGAMCVLGTEPREATDAEIASLSDLAAMVMAQVELQHAFGRVEPLSGLPNRNQFLEDLEDLVSDPASVAPWTAVVIEAASPEEFSNLVHVLGAGHADELVREAARALRLFFGRRRKIYHVGTTQFAFLAEQDGIGQDQEEALCVQLDEALQALEVRVEARAAAGIAPFSPGMTGPRDVLRMAHSAVQQAARSPRRVAVYSAEQDAAYQRRFTLLNAFGTALETPGQLRLVYQPRIDLASGGCTGAEALLRWDHPDLGPISPGEFMPIVEQTSMAQATTAWVLDEAMRQLAEWSEEGQHLDISVNVSARNLLETDFAHRVQAGLTRHKLQACQLELELTESAVMEDRVRAIAVLETLSQAGIRIAIDDFGTGYSSLAYLQRMPVYTVKIDQSFVRDLPDDERKRSLVATMVTLCHDFGFRVVAEGVENAAVLDAIWSTGCDEAQGYLFGRPMPACKFAEWRLAWAARAANARPGEETQAVVAASR